MGRRILHFALLTGLAAIPGPASAQIQSTYDYLLLPHAPQSDSARTYSYDANGNLIRSTLRSTGVSKTLEYTPSNMIFKAGGSEYRYDTSGARIAKIQRDANGNITKIERYFGAMETDGTTRTKYYLFGSKRVAKKTSAGALSFYHSDHLNSTSVVTDASGNFQTRMEFYEFGSVKSQEGTDSPKYAYTGQEWDKETNLYNYNARMYDSAIGKFTTADTIIPDITNPQSLNRYAYVRNNPLGRIDPTGHLDDFFMVNQHYPFRPYPSPQTYGGRLIHDSPSEKGYASVFNPMTFVDEKFDTVPAAGMAVELALTYDMDVYLFEGDRATTAAVAQVAADERFKGMAFFSHGKPGRVAMADGQLTARNLSSDLKGRRLNALAVFACFAGNASDWTGEDNGSFASQSLSRLFFGFKGTNLIEIGSMSRDEDAMFSAMRNSTSTRGQWSPVLIEQMAQQHAPEANNPFAFLMNFLLEDDNSRTLRELGTYKDYEYLRKTLPYSGQKPDPFEKIGPTP